MRLAVLGAGAWGTAISISLARRHDVTLWARDGGLVADMAATRVNKRYLAGATLPASVALTSHIEEAMSGNELVLCAVTSAGLRATLRLLAGGACRSLVWLCKGFEAASGTLPHQIVAAELPGIANCGVLSGPSFAAEVARGLPAALTLASIDGGFAADTARELHHATLRVYSSEDVTGVEIAGAVKNVMAIAAGICDGLELGHNARAALVTRGMAEITRLGLRLGGRLETFMGLSGMGDLMLTCTGDLSRNRSVGLKLARGENLPDVLGKLGHVAEGVYTARAANELASDLGVDMPITRAVCGVLDGRITPRDAVQELLQRDAKSELA